MEVTDEILLAMKMLRQGESHDWNYSEKESQNLWCIPAQLI